MKYGLNFGAKEITDEVRLKMRFPKRTRVAFTDGWYWLTLEGIATTEQDKNEMLIQADNGHRKIHAVVQTKNGEAPIWGIYLS